MVKHWLPAAGRFFMRQGFGKPQVMAGALLLVFLAQCAWLVSRSLRVGEMDLREWYRIDTGLRRWRTTPQTSAAPDPHSMVGPGPPPRIRDNQGFDPDHSALWYLISSAPLLLWPGRFQSQSLPYWGWLARAPYLLFGLLLGASLWYVARRLYGNEGGFVALTLYCFSPGIIRAASVWFAEPEIGATWGAFGAIFTGMAVAHTLYAPREVVLWNWRRIALLGVSFALAVGSQFSLVVMAPLALALMLYLAPTRRGAVLIIWTAACTVFPVALLTYVLWPRARYFGNTAPLLVALLCLVFGLATPHYQGLGFQLIALPFLFIFVAGICADLLESKQRSLVMAGIFGLLVAYAVWSLSELARVGRSG